MENNIKRIKEETLAVFIESLIPKYNKLLLAQLFAKKEDVKIAKNDLNTSICLLVQMSAALTPKYYKWFLKQEGDNNGDEKITANEIFSFFVKLNGGEKAEKFRERWGTKIWKEIKSKKNKDRAIEEFGDKNLCIVHLVISFIHQKMIRI